MNRLALAALGVAFALVVGPAVAALTVGPLGAMAGAVAVTVPVQLDRRRQRLVARRRVEAWPDALGDLHHAIRSASSLHAALVVVAERGPEPLRPAFVTYRELAVALTPAAALRAVRSELDDPVSHHVLDVLAVALDLGTGVVTELLDDLAAAVTAEVRLGDDLENAELETRLEARAAAVLPFAVLGLLCASVPGYRDFYSGPGGWVVVTAGSLLTAVGLVMIGRLAHTGAAR